MTPSPSVVSRIAIEGRRMVALIQDEPGGVPSAVICEAAADGSLTVLGDPVDIDAVIDATKRAIAGKSPPGSVTAELRNLRVALLGVVSVMQAMRDQEGAK